MHAFIIYPNFVSGRQCLPEIKARITAMMSDIQNSMDSLGEVMDSQGLSYIDFCSVS